MKSNKQCVEREYEQEQENRVPAADFFSDEKIMDDFYLMSKRQFLTLHPSLSEVAYDNTVQKVLLHYSETHRLPEYMMYPAYSLLYELQDTGLFSQSFESVDHRLFFRILYSWMQRFAVWYYTPYELLNRAVSIVTPQQLHQFFTELNDVNIDAKLQQSIEEIADRCQITLKE